MARDDWSEGYVVDMAYLHNFHPALAPLNLACAALAAGVTPPDVDRPFAWLDLGCGNGFSAALFAAGHPHADVWATDFNPAHIRNARATAAAAGITNATFLEASFAALADASLPRFDMVVLHGIWSWVSPANRREIVGLLDARLKPGGLVMISYNCHPGWDPLLPLRRLLIAGEGSTSERIERGLATARRLRDVGAAWFRDNPQASAMLDQLEHADRSYIAHEFCNAHWSLFHPGEVAAEVAPAGLTYIGQARTLDDIDGFWLTPAQSALLADEPDVAERQSLRDLILDRRFRNDLFVRDGKPLGEEAKATWIDARRFALARPRGDCALSVDMRAGPVALPAIGARLLDRLAQGPATGAALAGSDRHDVPAALLILVALGYIQPALPEIGEAARSASTGRFNAAALDAARMGDPAPALASPVTGSGLRVDPGDQLLLDAWRCGIPLEAMTGGADTDGIDPTARFRDVRLPLLELLGIA